MCSKEQVFSYLNHTLSIPNRNVREENMGDFIMSNHPRARLVNWNAGHNYTWVDLISWVGFSSAGNWTYDYPLVQWA